jgi:hypothetical protein
MGGKAAGQIVGDSRVESSVAAAEDVEGIGHGRPPKIADS